MNRPALCLGLMTLLSEMLCSPQYKADLSNFPSVHPKDTELRSTFNPEYSQSCFYNISYVHDDPIMDYIWVSSGLLLCRLHRGNYSVACTMNMAKVARRKPFPERCQASPEICGAQVLAMFNINMTEDVIASGSDASSMGDLWAFTFEIQARTCSLKAVHENHPALNFISTVRNKAAKLYKDWSMRRQFGIVSELSEFNYVYTSKMEVPFSLAAQAYEVYDGPGNRIGTISTGAYVRGYKAFEAEGYYYVLFWEEMLFGERLVMNSVVKQQYSLARVCKYDQGRLGKYDNYYLAEKVYYNTFKKIELICEDKELSEESLIEKSHPVTFLGGSSSKLYLFGTARKSMNELDHYACIYDWEALKARFNSFDYQNNKNNTFDVSKPNRTMNYWTMPLQYRGKEYEENCTPAFKPVDDRKYWDLRWENVLVKDPLFPERITRFTLPDKATSYYGEMIHTPPEVKDSWAMLYMGTANGRILKAALTTNRDCKECFKLIEGIVIKNNTQAIVNITVTGENQDLLYVYSRGMVALLRKEYCSHRDNCWKCLQYRDPLCVWDIQDGSCRYRFNMSGPFLHNLDFESSTDFCLGPNTGSCTVKATRTGDEQVTLTCDVIMDPVGFPVRFSLRKSFLIENSPEFVITRESRSRYRMDILHLNRYLAGRYYCSFRLNTGSQAQCSVNVTGDKPVLACSNNNGTGCTCAVAEGFPSPLLEIKDNNAWSSHEKSISLRPGHTLTASNTFGTASFICPSPSPSPSLKESPPTVTPSAAQRVDLTGSPKYMTFLFLFLACLLMLVIVSTLYVRLACLNRKCTTSENGLKDPLLKQVSMGTVGSNRNPTIAGVRSDGANQTEVSPV